MDELCMSASSGGIDGACKSTIIRSLRVVCLRSSISARAYLNAIVRITFTCVWSGGWCLQGLFQIGRRCKLYACLRLKNRSHFAHLAVSRCEHIYCSYVQIHRDGEPRLLFSTGSFFFMSSWETRET